MRLKNIASDSGVKMLDIDSRGVNGNDRYRTYLAKKLRYLADDLENIEQCLETTISRVRIKDYAVMDRAVPCLVGHPFGHPTIADGRAACTSELYYLDETRGLARTMSRWYRLDNFNAIQRLE